MRECDRYGLDYDRVFHAYAGTRRVARDTRAWWDYLIIAAAVGVFIWLGLQGPRAYLADELQVACACSPRCWS